MPGPIRNLVANSFFRPFLTVILVSLSSAAQAGALPCDPLIPGAPIAAQSPLEPAPMTTCTTAFEYPADSDSDGYPDSLDNCPLQYNPAQEDVDGDGVGDVDDNCVNRWNADQQDLNDDGQGDVCSDSYSGSDDTSSLLNCRLAECSLLNTAPEERFLEQPRAVPPEFHWPPLPSLPTMGGIWLTPTAEQLRNMATVAHARLEEVGYLWGLTPPAVEGFTASIPLIARYRAIAPRRNPNFARESDFFRVQQLRLEVRRWRGVAVIRNDLAQALIPMIEAPLQSIQRSYRTRIDREAHLLHYIENLNAEVAEREAERLRGFAPLHDFNSDEVFMLNCIRELREIIAAGDVDTLLLREALRSIARSAELLAEAGRIQERGIEDPLSVP